MMKRIIRTATPDDRHILTELKTAYIRSLYRGYIPSERLKALNPTPYDTHIADFLATPGQQVLLCEEEERPLGYLVIGEDPQDERCGMIFDAASSPAADEAVRDALVVEAASRLAEKGKERIYIWLLRDNFQARFLFERLNFKLEGSLRTYEIEGSEAQLIRYVYRIAK